MKNLAPVLITVYDRLDSLKNAINYLKKNSLSKQTDLFIVSDYAYKIEHVNKIREIREYITNNITGFKKVEGIFWNYNKGSFQSFIDALKWILNSYEKIIFFEDDILVSNKFLEYMNHALDFYKDEKRIFSIASHVHYNKIVYNKYPYEIFLLEMFSPWGAATWKDRFYDIDFSSKNIKIFLDNKENIKKINNISMHMMPILKQMIDKKQKYGDVIICINMIQNNKYTIYPIKPLSVNRGHDGRGEHCGIDEIWQNQKLINNFCPKLVKNIQFDLKIKKNAYNAFYSYKNHLIIPILIKIGIYKYIKALINSLKKGA